jgi:hypothetical protein
MSQRWRRNGPGSQKLVDDSGKLLGVVGRLDYCGYWYAYMGDNEDPEGTRFDFMWEAKRYVEVKVAKLARDEAEE